MSASRSNRNYRLIVGANSDRAVIIRPPFGVAFNGDKSVAGFGLNKLNLTVSNLQASHRLAMVKDAEESKRIPIIFEVGYGDELEKIYQGTVHRGAIARGGPNIDVTMECIDGGFDTLNSFTSQTVKGRRLAVNKILEDMPNTTLGKVRSQEDTIRAHVLLGASYDELLKLVGPDEQLFIDNEKLYIIGRDEVISTFVPLVNSESGLLGTPERENSKVTYQTLLNPALRLGGLGHLQSEISPYLNGIYKIDTINYNGDWYGANWDQTVQGYLSPKFTQVT